jgi:cytochrome c biogenesis protein CcmG/thiol:disulfide interchange protein DsbE
MTTPPPVRARWGALRWLIPLSAVPVLALLAYGFRTDPRAVPSPLVARPAPAFSLARLEGGGALSLADLEGKVVVLNFWASWCYPACYEEAPVLEATWRRWRDRGVVFVGVNMQDTDERAREFVRRFEYTFPNVVDRDGRTVIDYGVYGVPETFVIDREGRIATKIVGAVTPAGLEETLRALSRS